MEKRSVFIILVSLANLVEPLASQVDVTNFVSAPGKNATLHFQRMPFALENSTIWNASMTSLTCVGKDSIRCAASCARDPACSGFKMKVAPRTAIDQAQSKAHACKVGWKQLGGVCYSLTAGTFTWAAGDSYCKGIGGSLAYIAGDALILIRGMLSKHLSNDAGVWTAIPGNQHFCFVLTGAAGALKPRSCEENHRVVCQIPP